MKTEREAELKMYELFKKHVLDKRPQLLELDEKIIALMFGVFCIGFSIEVDENEN